MTEPGVWRWGGTRKSGLTGGLSQAPYARVCKFGLITRPIFSNSGGGTYPPDPPVAPSLVEVVMPSLLGTGPGKV